jgi:hypothetical protein
VSRLPEMRRAPAGSASGGSASGGVGHEPQETESRRGLESRLPLWPSSPASLPVASSQGDQASDGLSHTATGHHAQVSADRKGPVGEIWIFPGDASAAGHEGYIVAGSETFDEGR